MLVEQPVELLCSATVAINRSRVIDSIQEVRAHNIFGGVQESNYFIVMASNEALAKALCLAKTEEKATRIKEAHRKVVETLHELVETVDAETLLAKVSKVQTYGYLSCEFS